jgi:hypothetical protein
MLGRAIISLLLAVAVLLSLSCTKLPEWEATGEGDIAVEALPEINSIPLKWGNLVSVSTNLNQPYISWLWFQDENGSLRMVTYDMRANKFSTTARLIPRK